MDGHARVSGHVSKTMVIGGKTYRLNQPARVGLYAKLEAFFLERKQDPLVAAVKACEMAPKEMHASIWDAAMKAASAARVATAQEMADFEKSVWGLAFLFRECLDPQHYADVPDPEAALRLIEELGNDRLQELAATLQVVSGKDDLKNFAGPITTDRAPNLPTDTQFTAAGLDFIDFLQTSLDGPPSR